MRITPFRNTKQSKTMMVNFFYFRQSIDVRFMDTNLSVGQARCSSGGTQTSYCSVHIARNYMDLKCDMVKWHRITSHIRVVCWGEKIGRIRTQRLLSTVVLFGSMTFTWWWSAQWSRSSGKIGTLITADGRNGRGQSMALTSRPMRVWSHFPVIIPSIPPAKQRPIEYD